MSTALRTLLILLSLCSPLGQALPRVFDSAQQTALRTMREVVSGPPVLYPRLRNKEIAVRVRRALDLQHSRYEYPRSANRREPVNIVWATVCWSTTDYRNPLRHRTGIVYGGCNVRTVGDSDSAQLDCLTQGGSFSFGGEDSDHVERGMLLMFWPANEQPWENKLLLVDVITSAAQATIPAKVASIEDLNLQAIAVDLYRHVSNTGTALNLNYSPRALFLAADEVGVSPGHSSSTVDLQAISYPGPDLHPGRVVEQHHQIESTISRLRFNHLLLVLPGKANN